MITLSAGIHANVPMEAYHGNCCPGPSVSGSVLWAAHESCPAKALSKHYLSPWPRADNSTPAMNFGTAAHTLILEGPEVFAERYALKPEDFDGRTKAGKEWLAENAGRIPVTADDFAKISAMRRAIEEHPAARNAFTEGEAEITGIIQDAETGLWLKVRPDYLKKGLAINLKTTTDASERPWTFDAVKYGYHVGAALSVDVFKELGERVHYAFVIVEKSTPHLVAVRVLDDAFMEAGRMIYRRALRQFADCLASNHWTGFGDDVSTIPIPAWLDRQLTLSTEAPL